MTHSGGKKHNVGYVRQRFEVRVFDEDSKEEIVVGWSNSESSANSWAASLDVRPGWRDGRVIDLFAIATSE